MNSKNTHNFDHHYHYYYFLLCYSNIFLFIVHVTSHLVPFEDPLNFILSSSTLLTYFFSYVQ